MAKTWVFGAVGDVYVNRREPKDAFRHSEKLLRSVDLLFGNCEGSYTDRRSPSPGAGWVVTSPFANMEALEPAGFHVMACANNHILDGGYDGLTDTLEGLSRIGIQPLGAGSNSDVAREPVIVVRNGVRIGFLARSSVHPPAYAARAATPGVAAIRIHSHYYIKDGDPYSYVEPGATPHVSTFPWSEDVAQLKADIRRLKELSDVVVASFHWGTARVPVHLTDYEQFLGRTAIEGGVDIVLGHHHHFLRGVEFHRGKPIFYGLGHFVFDIDSDAMWSEEQIENLRAMGEYAIFPREGYPLLPFHPDARLTMMAAVEFDGSGIKKIGVIPCVLSPENHAVPVAPDSPDGEMVRKYLSDITARVDGGTEYISTPGFKVGEISAIEVKAKTGAALEV